MMQSTFHAVGDPRSTPIKLRDGLTMLEVIFAMVVILVGLVAVGLLIPLAGRQAADSYQITQGLAAGESAVAMVNTTKVAQPSVEAPWCLRDDSAGVGHSIGSMSEAYARIALTFPVQASDIRAAIAQNEAIGIGFCIDPLFWGNQQRVATNPLPSPFVRNRFPCLDDLANPITLQIPAPPNPQPRFPRLLRVSLSDALAPASWLKQPAATRIATMFGGDIVQLSPAENRASPPLRAIYTSPTTGFPLTGGPTAIDTPSWLMTVTPSENTPIIPLHVARQNFDGTVLANRPVQIPRTYNVAIVVFSKRDARDVNPAIDPSLQNLPVSERVFRVSGIGLGALDSGSFNVTLDTHPSIDPKIKISDWLMMSRYTKQDLLPRNAGTFRTISRQVHRWYRVVSLTDEQFLPASPSSPYPLIRRTVRVNGKPWDWTEGEINDFKEKREPMPIEPPKPSDYETHAVLLRDVVHVYERQVELQ